MEGRIGDSLSSKLMVATLSGGFAILALALAMVGLYGMLAYSASRRTREIGIRMALGSGSPAVVWMIAREALLLTAVGSLAGAVLAIAASRALSPFFAPVHAMGVTALGAGAAAVFLCSALAVCGPSLRACHIGPLSALRAE